MTFELNSAGAAEVLKTIAAQHIRDVAEQVGAAAGDDAIVDTYTTDRAAASISVPAEQQAKDGVLTRAAAAAGLEVKLK